MDAVTSKFNDTIFRVLKLCYLPGVVMTLKSQDLDMQVKLDCLENLQRVLRTCWSILKDMGAESQLASIQEFVELAFNQELMNAYHLNLSDHMYQSLVEFHAQLFKEMVDFSDKYWLLLRSLFNHLMFMFVARPYLISSFESFIVGFGTSRELRSLDAEIKLYKLQTIIPEVMPRKYEDFNLELITYHGAYIRTMTLIVVEGIVKNHILDLQQHDSTPLTEQTTLVLENIMQQLIEIPNQESKIKKQDQPWSDSHRLNIRVWQFLLVMI